jgi:hypothetical protein
MRTDPSQIRVLAVDDHAILLEGTAALINAESDVKLVADARNGREAIDRGNHRSVRSEFPNARIIVLTTYTGDVQLAYFIISKHCNLI